MMYFLIIGISMLLIVTLNMVFNTFSLTFGYIVVATVVLTISVIAADGVFATIIRHVLPNKWFDINSRWTSVSAHKLKFYERIGVRKWKDKVLELGMFSSFSKNNVAKKADSQYFARFVMECNCGWVIHMGCIFVGILIVFIYPLQYWYMFALPIIIVNAFLNYLPVCILRYNIPRLVKAHKLYSAREQRAAERQKAVQ